MLNVPLVRGAKGQKTEFTGAWAIFISNGNSTFSAHINMVSTGILNIASV